MLPRRHGSIAALLATLWVVAPVLSIAHFALEEHRYCAEHQTLEEAHGEPDTDVSARTESDFDSADRAPERGEDSHAPCLHSEPMVRDAVTSATDVVSAVALSCDPTTTSTATAPTAIATLHLAPKTSPPTLA